MLRPGSRNASWTPAHLQYPQPLTRERTKRMTDLRPTRMLVESVSFAPAVRAWRTGSRGGSFNESLWNTVRQFRPRGKRQSGQIDAVANASVRPHRRHRSGTLGIPRWTQPVLPGWVRYCGRFLAFARRGALPALDSFMARCAQRGSRRLWTRKPRAWQRLRVSKRGARRCSRIGRSEPRLDDRSCTGREVHIQRCGSAGLLTQRDLTGAIHGHRFALLKTAFPACLIAWLRQETRVQARADDARQGSCRLPFAMPDSLFPLVVGVFQRIRGVRLRSL